MSVARWIVLGSFVLAGCASPGPTWTGDEYGMAWRDTRDGNGEVYFARVSALGTEIGAEMREREFVAPRQHVVAKVPRFDIPDDVDQPVDE